MKIRDLVLLTFPLFIFSYISITFFLGNICSSDGCKLASTLISFDEKYLKYLGISFSFSLFLSLFMFKKTTNDIFLMFYKSIVLSALIFESILFFFQLKNDIFCIYCFGIFASLFLFSFYLFKDKIIFLIPIIFSLFLSVNILNIKKENILTKDLTLITSETCSHCKNVKENFKENKIAYDNLDIKEGVSILKTFNITSIPVLIKKEENGFKIIEGEKNIIQEITKPEENNVFSGFITELPTENKESCLIKQEKACN